MKPEIHVHLVRGIAYLQLTKFAEKSNIRLDGLKLSFIKISETYIYVHKNVYFIIKCNLKFCDSHRVTNPKLCIRIRDSITEKLCVYFDINMNSFCSFI